MTPDASPAPTMSEPTLQRIHLALERIRPALQLDGGDVKFVEFVESEGRLRIELSGAACTSGCHAVTTTMTMGIDRVLRSLVPEVRLVDTAASAEPAYRGRQNDHEDIQHG